jgi:ribosome-binding protein aMBF1 (putative translation factor)
MRVSLGLAFMMCSIDHTVREEYRDSEGMATDICVRFGRRLRNFREKKGLNQIDLSVHTGLARTHISRLENGRKEPCLRTLELLATALEMKPWELIKGI